MTTSDSGISGQRQVRVMPKSGGYIGLWIHSRRGEVKEGYSEDTRNRERVSGGVGRHCD